MSHSTSARHAAGRTSARRTAGRLLAGTALAAVATVGTSLAGGPAAFAASMAGPANPVSAYPNPAVVEGFGPYAPQTTCSPTPKPGVLAFRDLMLATYRTGYDGGISRPCSYGGTSEHEEGRAWDWMLNSHDPAQNAVARQALDWLTAPGPDGQPGYNARRLGVMYMIYNHQIWGVYNTAAGWRPYTGCSGATACHEDHIHFSFEWAGALKETSWWTGVPAAGLGRIAEPGGQTTSVSQPPASQPPASQPPASGPLGQYTGQLLQYGITSSAAVLALQHALGVSPAYGDFGPKTLAAVQAFQRSHGLVVDGVVGPQTWAALLGASAAPVVTTVTTVSTGSGLTQYRSRLLSYGLTKDPAVLALQHALGISPAYGDFGPKTLAAVKAFQASHGLVVDGVVGPQTWAALTAAVA